jgi:hypothetical protein
MNPTNTFDEFLLKEYENIATAHFESQKQFALFFRYYTLFFSIPIVVFFYNDEKKLVTDSEFGWLMITLSIIGIFFFWYAVNLKNEAVLYARTVNGIRNHFYKNVPIDDQKRLRTLPTDIFKPAFYSPINPVLLIIISVNVAALTFGLVKINFENTCLLVVIATAAVVIHFFANYQISQNQSKTYPTSQYDC